MLSPTLLLACNHLLEFGEAYFLPVMHVSGVQRAGSDAGCAVVALERLAAKRVHQAGFAGASFSHQDETGA